MDQDALASAQLASQPRPQGTPPIGRAPGPRAPLPAIPEAPLEGFGSVSLSDLLFVKALDLLDSPSHKVRATVLHDLLDVQGLLGKRRRTDDDPEVHLSSPTLNAIIMNESQASPIIDSIRELARGMRHAGSSQ